MSQMISVACISDTHNKHNELNLPDTFYDSDIIIHAGDLTSQGTLTELEAAGRWLASLGPEIVVIAGNHDFTCQEDPKRIKNLYRDMGIHYLQDESTIIKGLKFYGSPWSPWFYNWAFNFPRSREAYDRRAKLCWDLIPDDTDVLITHTPPYKIFDQVNQPRPGEDPNVGCQYLRKRLEDLSDLQLHVFGHIHEGYASDSMKEGGPLFINASSCTDRYRPSNPPQYAYLTPKGKTNV